MEKILDTVVLMLEGSQVTLEIFFITMLLSMAIGLLAALGRMSGFKPLNLMVEI